MAFVTTGEREFELKLDAFPRRLHDLLAERIVGITEMIEERSVGAAPSRTGALRSEITQRTFTDSPTRVAGYVEVYAPGVKDAYVKAATLEYGSDKPRRAFERTSNITDRLAGSRRAIIGRLSEPVHIEAYRYLRGPLEELEPDIEAQLQSAVDEATEEAS